MYTYIYTRRCVTTNTYPSILCTRFGNQQEYVHGINLMPITPATTLLFDQAYVTTEYPFLARTLDIPDSDSPHGSPSCDANEKCAGLVGNCCPNNDGEYLACCDNSNHRMQDEWLSLIYLDHAIIDRDAAWKEVLSINGYGNGNSRSNSLMFVASRLPGVSYNASSVNLDDPKLLVKAACSANSACVTIGLSSTGNCCPSNSGIYLGCCPVDLFK